MESKTDSDFLILTEKKILNFKSNGNQIHILRLSENQNQIPTLTGDNSYWSLQTFMLVLSVTRNSKSNSNTLKQPVSNPFFQIDWNTNMNVMNSHIDKESNSDSQVD